MSRYFTTILGKSVRMLAQLRGGAGSALPGLFVEKIDPNFIKRTLMGLPRGVVVISGTNGKTTTTKMVVELLESQGLKVFTNRTGSNFTRGVAAALLGEIDTRGQLDADIAVLELDEAHAVHFVKAVAPRYALFLNVMRDQLDRFGEIDTTADLLHRVAMTVTDGIVINRDDPRLVRPAFVESLTVPLATYGVTAELRGQFPSDDTMRHHSTAPATPESLKQNDTELFQLDNQTASIRFMGKERHVPLKLKGIYNVLNAVGAVALVRMIMGDDLNEDKIFSALSLVTPAFGRGETIMIDEKPCELVLVKNPSGFRLSLQSFDATDTATMIAINDNYADGRDMSWLWDVEFDSLRATGVDMVTGVRAFDMALRLDYDDVPQRHVNPEIAPALDSFLAAHHHDAKRIYCTYTTMLAIRKLLAKYTDVETVR